MKNTLILGKPIISILLILSLVISMAAVVLQPKEVKAVTTGISIVTPNPGAIAYAKGGGTVSVQYNVADSGVPPVTDVTVTFEIYQGTTPIHLPNAFVRTPGTGPWTNLVPIAVGAAAGIYDIKATATGGGTWTSPVQIGSVIIDAIAPTVNLQIPSATGGECWQSIDTTRKITLTVSDNYAGNVSCLLEYSSTGVFPGTTIATVSVPQATLYEYTWNPLPGVDSNLYKVRVTATDIAGNSTIVTTGSFTIDANAPVVTMVYPVGGETVNSGATMNIQWNTSHLTFSGNVTYELRYSTTGFAGTWSTYPLIVSIPNAALGAQNYTWTVPSVCSTTVRVGIRATDCSGLYNNPPAQSTNFTITDTSVPVVRVISPNGGETWRTGSGQTIRWNATDAATTDGTTPGTMKYEIQYCTDFNVTTGTWLTVPGGIITSQPQGDRPLSWTVPTITATSSTCRVKVIATDCGNNISSDVSDNNFTILRSDVVPTVTLTAPTGGPTWQAGTPQTISWAATSAVPTDQLTIKLEYVGTPTATIAVLRNKDQGSGSFCWAVKETLSGSYQIRITATDPGGLYAIATSTSFTINAGDPAVITQTISLVPGWNLISLQLMPTCTTVDGVLANFLCEDVPIPTFYVNSVWYYNTATGTWSSWGPGSPSTLAMADGKGYWVNFTGTQSRTFQGRKCNPAGGGGSPPVSNYSTLSGWNLVGFKSTADKHVEIYLGTANYVTPIYEWNGTDYVGKSAGDHMTPGKGYWVNYTASGTISPGCD